MPYLIDGHNLIASLHDIHLDDPDDEARLIDLLRTFCAHTGKGLTVYFDQRAPGATNPPTMGGLRVRFITPPRTADDAILAHLHRLGREAHNWTVVSSDNLIRRATIQAGARSINSHAFAQLLEKEPEPVPTEKPSAQLSDDEIATWEAIFKQRGKNGGND